jgi:hypothetical protein
MRQIDGAKEYVLTWGDLIEMLSTLSNLFSDKQLNYQESADVIVPFDSRTNGKD